MMQPYERLALLDRITRGGQQLRADSMVDRLADRRAAGTEHIAGTANRFRLERRQVAVPRCVARDAARTGWQQRVVLGDARITALTLDHPPERLECTARSERALHAIDCRLIVVHEARQHYHPGR